MKMKNKNAEQKAAKQKHKETLKARKRSEPNLERPDPILNEKPSILIVCEGKNTEPSYFNQFRLSLATVKSVGKGYNTLSLVDWAIQLSNQKKYDQVWCVFDKDGFTENDFNNAIQKAQAEGFGIAYSNQAFEYWLILHLKDHQGGGMDRQHYHHKINSLLAPFKIKYDGKQSKIVEEDFFEVLDGVDAKTKRKRVDLAIQRAEKIYNQLDHSNPAKEESSTTVFRLVIELLKYR